jgi:hypothetical protein
LPGFSGSTNRQVRLLFGLIKPLTLWFVIPKRIGLSFRSAAKESASVSPFAFAPAPEIGRGFSLGTKVRQQKGL